MEIELEHDVGTVGFGGVDGDAKEGGDFLVALAFCEELENFAFARRETGAGSTGGIGGSGGGIRRIGGAGDAGGEVGLVVTDGIDSGEEDAVSVVLEDVATGAGFDHLLNEVVGFVHGEDEDFGVRRGGVNAAGGLNPIEERHADVEDRDIGLEFGGFFDRIATVGGFGADFPTGATLKESAEAGANDGMIIRDKDTKNGHRLWSPWEKRP